VNACSRIWWEGDASTVATNPTPQESWSKRSSRSDGTEVGADEGADPAAETRARYRSMIQYTSGEREIHRRHLSVKVGTVLIGERFCINIHDNVYLCIASIGYLPAPV